LVHAAVRAGYAAAGSGIATALAGAGLEEAVALVEEDNN